MPPTWSGASSTPRAPRPGRAACPTTCLNRQPWSRPPHTAGTRLVRRTGPSRSPAHRWSGFDGGCGHAPPARARRLRMRCRPWARHTWSPSHPTRRPLSVLGSGSRACCWAASRGRRDAAGRAHDAAGTPLAPTRGRRQWRSGHPRQPTKRHCFSTCHLARSCGNLFETRHPQATPGIVRAASRPTGQAPAVGQLPAVQLDFLVSDAPWWPSPDGSSPRSRVRCPCGRRAGTYGARCRAVVVGADGSIPPAMRSVLGADRGGAVAFFIVLAR